MESEECGLPKVVEVEPRPNEAVGGPRRESLIVAEQAGGTLPSEETLAGPGIRPLAQRCCSELGSGGGRYQGV